VYLAGPCTNNYLLVADPFPPNQVPSEKVPAHSRLERDFVPFNTVPTESQLPFRWGGGGGGWGGGLW